MIHIVNLGIIPSAILNVFPMARTIVCLVGKGLVVQLVSTLCITLNLFLKLFLGKLVREGAYWRGAYWKGRFSGEEAYWRGGLLERWV